MPLDFTATVASDVTQTPVTMLYKWEAERGDTNFLNQPRENGQVESYTWKQVADQARRVAFRLREKNYPAGSRIGIFAKNCAEWFITDLGIMLAGHVSVPIFASAGDKTIHYVLQHADVKLMFLGKLDNMAALDSLPDTLETVYYDYPGLKGTHRWADFIDCNPISDDPEPNLDAMMTIIYTSGSTGQPKGVVHTYRTICWAARNSLNALSVNTDDRLLSYLPLAHITERVLVELAAFYAASRIFFVESLDTFQRDVHAAQPTLFVSVPRLWTKFQMGVLAKMPQKKLDFLLSLPIIRNIVSRKIRTGLGIDKARFWASGSAPLAPPVIEWFHRVGINISEGWGMTENSAYGTASVPFRADKIGTIGRAYNGVDIRLSDDGEIQVKSPCNMVEYYLEPEKTAETFTTDGYLKTGDKGAIDSEGFIRITGRLKDIFKTEKGKYVTPAPIEASLMANPIIEQVCVTGTNLPQPVAIVVLSDVAQKYDRQGVGMKLASTLDVVNAKLEAHQKVDRIIVVDEPWTVENNLLTPTLKVKRHILEEHYEGIIHDTYNEKVEFVSVK